MTNRSFSADDFHAICDQLAAKDQHLSEVIGSYGYPPFWHREPGFATLVHIILEQQVSLASALSAYSMLQKKTGVITPAAVLALSDLDLRNCYFSRQKTEYVRHLAEAIIEGRLNLDDLSTLPDDVVRERLMAIKGIGRWTAEVYMMMVLHRHDLFPTGDIALLNSMKEIKGLSKNTTKEGIEALASAWQPYRTVAAYLLWHNYLSRRKSR